MKWFISKKKHDEIVYALECEVDHQFNHALDLDAQARDWRKKYELSQLTPEIKVDIESAFTRGEHNANMKLSAILMEMAFKLRNDHDIE